jgi:hypothetical protein
MREAGWEPSRSYIGAAGLRRSKRVMAAHWKGQTDLCRRSPRHADNVAVGVGEHETHGVGLGRRVLLPGRDQGLAGVRLLLRPGDHPGLVECRHGTGESTRGQVARRGPLPVGALASDFALRVCAARSRRRNSVGRTRGCWAAIGAMEISSGTLGAWASLSRSAGSDSAYDSWVSASFRPSANLPKGPSGCGATQPGRICTTVAQFHRPP